MEKSMRQLFKCACGCGECLLVMYTYEDRHSHGVSFVMGPDLDKGHSLQERSVKLSPAQWSEIQTFVASGYALEDDDE